VRTRNADLFLHKFPVRHLCLDQDFSSSIDRHIVLRDLVGLRKIRIKIILSVEFQALGDFAIQRKAGFDPEFQRLFIHHRQ